MTAEPGELGHSSRDGERMAETFAVSVETIFPWNMGEDSLNLVNMRSPQKTGSALKLVVSRAEELHSVAILCENAENKLFVVWWPFTSSRRSQVSPLTQETKREWSTMWSELKSEQLLPHFDLTPETTPPTRSEVNLSIS